MEGFQDIEHFVKSLYAAIKKKIPTKVSQLTNDAGYKTTDTNTTYKLSKSGSTVTLTGSDGSTTSVTDSNTTYSSLKNPYSLTIQNNGTTVASYDGSTAQTVNLTNATASSAGLMSKSDKAKLDGIASLYPVGSIYLSTNDTNPATFIGGTWERLKDVFLLAAGDTYAAGSTGGEAQQGEPLSAISEENGETASAKNIEKRILRAGEYALDNMPPYLAVYMWKRTA